MTELDKIISKIIEGRNKLSRLAYNDPRYDRIEEKLHDIEDIFLDKFGSRLERVIFQVYQKYKIPSEMLSPLAYIAKSYVSQGKNEDETENYTIASLDVALSVDDDTFLVLVPNPTRLLLYKNGKSQEVWNSLKD
ncbi:MAG: hypothetical protein NZ551_01640 [Microscillaceae bacterium]|nr:hypothetical protein [Microscillaceae bacterium]MDW8459890.1 hypothetical protein [Cytophagales bacterium]